MTTNPRDKHYNLGLYHSFQFNKKDLEIRTNLGLYAEEFLIEEDIPLALRRLAKNPLEKILIIPASEVLDTSESSKKRYNDYVLYAPIERMEDLPTQTLPNYNPFRDPFGNVMGPEHPFKNIEIPPKF